ncbi:hypothetical protein FJZ33_07070, partial [Candidatus Poribacteria bacterium]|nr:hypothetical protein [Candidatus Poribacteria bacterium]
MLQDERMKNGNKPLYQPPMGESTLRDYIRIIFIRKWLALGILLVTIISTLIYLRITPPIYESQVLMMRETTADRLPADLIGLSLGVDQWNKGQELLLKSDVLLVDVKDELLKKYDIQISIDQLEGSLSIAPYERDNSALELKANADTPIQAQALADVASSTYIKHLSDIKRTEVSQGMMFLKQQMDQFEKKIRETEQAVNDFLRKQDAGFARPTLSSTGIASSGLIEALGKMQTELSESESEIVLANSQLSSINELIAEKKRKFGSSDAPELTSQMDQLQKQLVNLRIEKSTKLETLTEKDPEVLAIQRRIDIVQEQLKQEFGRLMTDPDLIGVNPISELQSLVQQSVTLSVQIKGLERKSALIKDKIEKFKAEHPELLSKEMEFVRLDRQRRVEEQTYSSLMSKYEDLRLLEQMKTSGVRLIDSPRLPQSPKSPKKTQTMIMGIVLGLFLAI